MTKKRQRHLLVIGGGVFQVPAIKVAKSMGLKVVVTDYNGENNQNHSLILNQAPYFLSTKHKFPLNNHS